MTLIDQLEHVVTPKVAIDSSVAHSSLLEQFYAILISRLAIADVYNQLQRNQASTASSNDAVFHQLWTQSNQRKLIISELAQTHHIDELETEQLITSAAPLGFQKLKDLAEGQFLPAFLQSKQAAIRHYLPVWAAEVIVDPITPLEQIAILGRDKQLDGDKHLGGDKQLGGDEQESDEPVLAQVEATLAVDGFDNLSALKDIDATDTEDTLAMPVIAIDKDDGISNDGHDKAIHTSASVDNSPAYANLNASTKNLSGHHAKKSPNNWLIPILLLIIALSALALLWFLVIQPKFMQPAVPVEPIAIEAPAPAPAAPVLKPVQLTIAVDDSGSLYTCTATIGDASLQNKLRQILTTSFGEQASICEFVVEQGVAIDLADIGIDKLPDILLLVRAIPFARLELQDNNVRLEAPDNTLLQQLANNMRSLLPMTSVTTIDPAPLPNDLNNTIADNGLNNANSPDSSLNSDTGFSNNDINSNPNFQPADDDTNDRVTLIAPRNNDSLNNTNSPNVRNNAFSNRNQTSGPISESEVDSLANTAIVAEPLRNARPVDNNINLSNQ